MCAGWSMPDPRSLSLNQMRVEPALSPIAPAAVTAPPHPATFFSADLPSGPDLLGRDAAMNETAELVAHAATPTPLSLGLFGPAGSGKSHLLHRLLGQVNGLTIAASKLATSPFLSRIATLRIPAASLQENTVTALAAALYSGLVHDPAAPDGAAELARDAVNASTDPRTAAREAADQLDEVRRRLDAERRALEELDGKRARLMETVLYEAAGSRVDAYARTNRPRIEGRLRAFGFSGEPVQTFKDLVRDYTERGGVTGRLGVFLRSLWGFEGQTSLLVWAILFFLAGWGIGFAADTQKVWIPAFRNLAEALGPVANWIEAHTSWLGLMRTGAIAAAVLCLLANITRAIRLLAPIMRGASLLRADADLRRGELDTQLSHQTRRVDTLNAEVEAQAKRLEEAERRTRDAGRSGQSMASDQPFAAAGGTEPKAMAFISALTAALSGGGGGPQRLVVAIDDLESVTAKSAAQIVETVQQILAFPQVVTIFSVDAAHLALAWNGPASAAARLERLIQIPLSVDTGIGREDMKAYARRLLEPASVSEGFHIDASRSRLDEPLTSQEADLLAALSPLAGNSPRVVKRFVNIYRLARCRTADRASLALMLALDLGGSSGELATLGAAMDEHTPDSAILMPPGEPRLADAIEAAAAAQGHAVTVGSAQAAWRIARDYRIPV